MQTPRRNGHDCVTGFRRKGKGFMVPQNKCRCHTTTQGQRGQIYLWKTRRKELLALCNSGCICPLLCPQYVDLWKGGGSNAYTYGALDATDDLHKSINYTLFCLRLPGARRFVTSRFPPHFMALPQASQFSWATLSEPSSYLKVSSRLTECSILHSKQKESPKERRK